MPTTAMGFVVSAVDGSVSSMDALDLAAEEAIARVVPLVIVQVDNGNGNLRPVLSAARSRVTADHPGLSVSTELLAGDPAEELARRSADASLLVLGHRGWHDGGLHALAAQFGVGSVAIGVLGRTAAPVVVHRPVDCQPTPGEQCSVLIGVSGGAGDDNTLEFGFREADMRGAPVTAIYVWSQHAPGIRPKGATDGPSAHRGSAAGRGFDTDREQAELVLADRVAPWADKFPSVPVRKIVRHSLDVPVALVAASRTAQLTVVGSPHYHGLARLMHNSVSHSLVARAHSPIAVIAS